MGRGGQWKDLGDSKHLMISFVSQTFYDEHDIFYTDKYFLKKIEDLVRLMG